MEFGFSEDGSLIGSDYEPTGEQREFFDRVEAFTQRVFAANEAGL